MGNDFANALKRKEAMRPSAGASASTSRDGRKHIGGYFPRAVSAELRHLAVEEDTTVQRLLEEALDLLFQARGRATIQQKRSR